MQPLFSPTIHAAAPQTFAKRGFWVCPNPVVSAEGASNCCARLACLLRGEYDTGLPPTKIPVYNYEQLAAEDKRKRATLQIINVHRADHTLRSVVMDPRIGELVCFLTGWSGARVAQDQAWIKPAGCVGLSFHRDSMYFDFDPPDVVTVWITFDDISTPEKALALGALEYCEGSHLWGDKRSGFNKQFFSDDYRQLLYNTAEIEGIEAEKVCIERVLARPGGLSIHNGRTWHGSGPNTSSGMRRGVGIHFVPRDVKWRSERVAPIWKPYKTEGSDVVNETYFPVTWQIGMPSSSEEAL